eukprot:TRINITY_DN10495_c0_g1_i1.p2 TRINITY_DN10495_c0_g1~~TRINITY_DN10495_c0_g1_i1.p2  ORF type:complete len:115 (-),score=21.69 TRINITY_DN10495_c0_g1_i1:180-524(-)
MFFCCYIFSFIFFFQAEDGIRDHAQSRGLGDVYKRQNLYLPNEMKICGSNDNISWTQIPVKLILTQNPYKVFQVISKENSRFQYIKIQSISNMYQLLLSKVEFYGEVYKCKTNN